MPMMRMTAIKAETMVKKNSMMMMLMWVLTWPKVPLPRNSRTSYWLLRGE